VKEKNQPAPFSIMNKEFGNFYFSSLTFDIYISSPIHKKILFNSFEQSNDRICRSFQHESYTSLNPLFVNT